MSLILRHLRKIADAAYNTTGGAVNIWYYATPDAIASVLAAGYFNGARERLKVNDTIFVNAAADATGDFAILKVTDVPASGDVTSSAEEGYASPIAITATADGLTTGLITAAMQRVEITSANADHIVTLPAIAGVPFNHVIRGYIAATGCEIRTPASSNTKINNVDADGGAAEMALPANSIFVATKHATDNWIVEVYVAAGTRTIPTPD